MPVETSAGHAARSATHMAGATLAIPRGLLAVAMAMPVIACGGTSLRNGSAEMVADGKPVNWGRYDSVTEWGTLEDGYRGRGAYFVPGPLRPIETGARAGEDYVSGALVLGSPDGYNGAEAFVVVPDEEARFYRYPGHSLRLNVSFRAINQGSEATAYVQCWNTEDAAAAHRSAKPKIAPIPSAAEWTLVAGSVTLPPDTRRFALMFQLHGYRNDGVNPGRICVDEVTVERQTERGMTADDLARVEIPATPSLYVGDAPLDSVLGRYREGDGAALKTVRSALEAAERWAARSDAWYRQFYRSFEPRGVYTVTCPLHPFRTRYYNDFSWSIDEPWRLTCEHCKAEGRAYYHYPNPDYPDDGSGCAPTDEVWARTHDATWSQTRDGIPHDRWDGSTHGDCGGGRRYYFLGKYYVNVLLYLQRTPVRALALGWHYATKLFAPDSKEHRRGDTYAHKAQTIVLCTARAYLGDDYLAAAEGVTPEQFRARMEGFYRNGDGTPWKYEKLTGFRPFDHTDTTVGDPLYEDRVKARPYAHRGPFIGAWNWRALQADDLLVANCMLRETFAPSQDDVRRMCQRPAISVPGDRERVARLRDPIHRYLKRGCVEMELQPYSMVAAGDNLAASTLGPVLRMGLMLRDDRILDNVARDIYYFYRNHLTEDGLGAEGAPTYTPSLTGIMETLHGMTGGFDSSAPYWDRETGSVNLFKMDAFRHCVPKMMYYATEDDHYVAWEDSVYSTGKRKTTDLEYVENYGGGVPAEHRRYLLFEERDNGSTGISFKRSESLPSLLLNDRRKAILRAGSADAPALVSLNFTKACGHLHDAVMDLVLHAHGQELMSDLGYLGSDHFLRPWLSSHAAHNCLVLRKADGDPRGTTKIRGDIRRHFVVAPHCQVVDAAEYDQADWRAFDNGETGEMSRQVILMTPDPRHHYVVDLARGRGGESHDYYLHSHGQGFDVEGVQLTAQVDPATSLYDYSGWTFSAAKYAGARCVTKLSAGTAPGPWQATWSRIDDYRGRPAGEPLIHDDVFLRLWMIDEPGSEVIVGEAPAQRHFKNEDIGRRMKVVCVRRPDTESVDTFAAVIEPYRATPFIRGVRRLEPGTDDEYTIALAVDTVQGTDYVIAYGGPAEPPDVRVVDNGHTITTNADVAVVSCRNGAPAHLLIAGGSQLTADNFTLAPGGPAQYSGRLLDFDDSEKTLTIHSSDPFPEGTALAGQPVIIQHAEDRSSFTIASVERAERDRYVVHLAGCPRLCKNWLLVKEVNTRGIVVEPPPILDRKQRTFKVYVRNGQDTRLLGPFRGTHSVVIRNEFGTEMTRVQAVVTDDSTGVSPGDELGITRLEKGRDTVFVTNFAYASVE